MSNIQNDKEVVQEGRKEALKDVDAPLRDQVVSKLYDQLDELEIAQKVRNLWSQGSATRQAWLERQKEYLSTWDEHLVADTDGPFQGSSQLHLPVTFTICKTAHARFMAALWQDPPCYTKADNEASTERAPVVQDTMRYYLLKGANYHSGVRRVVDQWVWDWITTGSGIMKWRWDVLYERYLDVETSTEPGIPKYAVINGKETLVPTQKPVEKEVEKVDKCFEGPVLDLVNHEDILIIGGGGDPDQADVVIHRQWLTASELWTLADRKVFRKDAVEKIIEAGPDLAEGSIGSEIKTQRAQQAGQASHDTLNDHDRYEILEAHMRVDVNGSGINTGVITWVHPRSAAHCRATYARRVSKSGKRPFVKADFQIRKGQEYGIGLVELLYPLARELDAMHNMRIDFGLISVMPFGFYRPASGIDPENIQFEPGQLIPCENPGTDVFFPQLGNRTFFGVQEEQSLMQMIERLTSISDMNLGVIGGQGATRTATGARALMSETGSNLDVYLGRLNEGWKKALIYLLQMLQERIPAGLSFRVTGDSGKDYWRTIKTPEEIAGMFDIEVSPNSSSSNTALQAQTADEILQFASNPLAMQMQTVGPGQFYEAAKNWLQSRQIKDWSRYLHKPDGYERMMTPEEEANRVLRGVEVPVTPSMDHEGFMAFYEMFEKDDQLMGQFTVPQIGLLKIQAMKHAQMLQALKAQQAQQANQAQMQMNARSSMQQAPMGPNPAAPPANPNANGGGGAPQQ